MTSNVRSPVLWIFLKGQMLFPFYVTVYLLPSTCRIVRELPRRDTNHFAVLFVELQDFERKLASQDVVGNRYCRGCIELWAWVSAQWVKKSRVYPSLNQIQNCTRSCEAENISYSEVNHFVGGLSNARRGQHGRYLAAFEIMYFERPL